MRTHRFFSAPYHTLTVTYLKPIDPPAGDDPSGIAFANKVRSQMAMALDATMTTQSYEELWLWKLGLEKLGLPSSVLRTLDFKAAKERTRAGGAKEALTVDGAKVALRRYKVAYDMSASERIHLETGAVAKEADIRVSSPGSEGVSMAGFTKAISDLDLGAKPKDLWRKVATKTGNEASSGAEVIDFAQFLVGIHRLGPKAFRYFTSLDSSTTAR